MDTVKRNVLARTMLILSIQLIGIILIMSIKESLSSIKNPIISLYLFLWFFGYFETYYRSTYQEKSKDHFQQAFYYLYDLWLTIGLFLVIYDYSIIYKQSRINLFMTYLGLLVFAIGAVIFRISRKTLRDFYSPQLIIQENHKLIRHRIYRYIRHPIYLGGSLIHISFPLVFSSLYGVLYFMGIFFFVLLTIRIEEKMLLEYFGDAYQRYCSHTKRIIPFIY